MVLADGFFEWNRKGKQKRPYFIHFRNNKPTSAMEELDVGEKDGAERAQEGRVVREERVEESHSGSSVEEKRKLSEEEEGEEGHVLNGRMLTMAGLFDICTEQEQVHVEPLHARAPSMLEPPLHACILEPPPCYIPLMLA